MKKIFLVKTKEIYIVNVIVEAETEIEALKLVYNGGGEVGDDIEKGEQLHPSTWEVLEV